MAVIAPAVTRIEPSYTMPEMIVPYSQPSGAFECLPDGDMMQRLSDGDLAVYINRVDIRTQVAAGNSSYNSLPSISASLSTFSCPTYLMRNRAIYDHHDTAAVARWGMSVVDVHRYGMRQAHFQQARNALLYGFNPANGEGLLNTPGATMVTLPADNYGNVTITTYDNFAMAQFFLTQVQQLKSRMFQLGQGREFTILGPQRTLGPFEYNVVSLVQAQAKGGGTLSTAGVLENVAQGNGDTIKWVYDDTLIGKGAGGTDAVILVMPKIIKPADTRISTNEFAKIATSLGITTAMLCDMAAPREIPTPLPGGAIDVVAEMRITPGWGIRSEAITILSMPYQ